MEMGSDVVITFKDLRIVVEPAAGSVLGSLCRLAAYSLEAAHDGANTLLTDEVPEGEERVLTVVFSRGVIRRTEIVRIERL